MLGYQIVRNNRVNTARFQREFTDGTQIGCLKRGVRRSYFLTETGSHDQLVSETVGTIWCIRYLTDNREWTNASWEHKWAFKRLYEYVRTKPENTASP